MNTRFRPYHPEQSYLLQPSPSDWLPEGHLTRRRFGAMLGRIALLPIPTG
jgi:hypothetical protein